MALHFADITGPCVEFSWEYKVAEFSMFFRDDGKTEIYVF